MTPLTIDADTRLISAENVHLETPNADKLDLSQHILIFFDPRSGLPIAVCRPLASGETAPLAELPITARQATEANGLPFDVPHSVPAGVKLTLAERAQLQLLWKSFPDRTPAQIAHQYAQKYGRKISEGTARYNRPTAGKGS